MAISSDDQLRPSSSQSFFHPSSPRSSFLLAVQLAVAYRISQLSKSIQFVSKLPIAAGLPPLFLPSKLSPQNRSASYRKSSRQEDCKPKDVSPASELEEAKEPLVSRIVARTAGEDCSTTEKLSPVSSSVVCISEDGDSQSLLALGEKPESEAVSDDVARHTVLGVPLVENLFEDGGEKSKYLQKRSSDLVPEENVVEEIAGSQAGAILSEQPLESEISIDSSAKSHARRNDGTSFTAASQLGNTNWSTGYDSEVEDNLGSEAGLATYKKSRGSEILDKEFNSQTGRSQGGRILYPKMDNLGNEAGQATYKKGSGSEILDEEIITQTDRSQGRAIQYPEVDHMDGASVYRMPEEQTDQSSNASVYRMPGEQTEQSSSILSPTQWVVAAFQFQVQLIVLAASWIESLFQWGTSFTSNRIEESWQAKDRATEAVTQRVVEMSSVPPKISGAGVFLVKRAAWGCLAVTYIFCLLGMLLVPALFLDFAFVSRIVDEPASIKKSVHFDYTEVHPTAVVLLRPLQDSWGSSSKLARYHENFKAIPISHRVHITVKLTLPESHYNRHVGMFQLTVELLSENGKVVKSSSRPCLLRYHSVPIRLAKTFLAGLPILGLYFETQTLVVHVMEFEEQHVSTGAVRILLQPKAGMKVGLGIPELYSAEVHIESFLPWPKEILYKWKWTFYIWMALVFYIMEILMILCCCRQVLMPSAWFSKTEEVSHDRRVRKAAVTSRVTGKLGYNEGQASFQKT